jgi:hypothetical protein
VREATSRTNDPQVHGLIVAAEGYHVFHTGNWRAGLDKFNDAEVIFRDRCSGATWELANVHLFQLIALAYLGEARTLVRTMPALLDEAESHGDRFALTSFRSAASSIVWLVGDDAEGGRRDVVDALSSWSQRGFHLQHFYALCAIAQCDLYSGEAKKGLAAFEKQWPEVEASLLLRLERLRIEAHYARGRLLVATAIAEGATSSDGRALLRRAAHDAKLLAAEEVAYAAPFAALVRASIAGAEKAHDGAIEQLRAAVSGFEAHQMKLHAHAAQRALGTLLGGDEGESLRARASLWMDEQEVGNPPRLTALLVPGFDT